MSDKLDSDQCWLMINQKKCIYGAQSENMICDDDFLNCRYEKFPLNDYHWMKDITKSFAHCYFSTRMISETNLDSHIFNGYCKVSDWFCALHDSIIVWHRDVYHLCEFRRVSEGSILGDGVNFVEKTQKLGFQFKRLEMHCGVDMILTTEGLYIAPLLPELAKLEKYSDYADTKGSIDLLLADSDYTALETQEGDRYLLFKECVAFLAILKNFAIHDDRFIRLKDYNSNDIILYTLNGQIFIPNCVKINDVILMDMVSCFEDLPVTFKIKNRVCKGYTTMDRIIKASSVPKQCSYIPRYIPLPLALKTIIFSYLHLNLVDTVKIKFEKLLYN